MDIGKVVGKIPKWFYQYRYPIIILLIGLILLTVPSKTSGEKQTQTQTTTVTEEKSADQAQLLAEILGQMEGVGKVKVLLTVSTGETTVYHSDEDVSTSENSSTVRKETVIITDSEKNQKPLITQVIPATYKGAVIVCQGADNPSIKWAVVEAVSKATGLGADQISVLKMK